MACEVVTSDRLVVASLSYRGPASGVGAAFDHLLRWGEVHFVEQWSPLVWVHEDAPIDDRTRGDGTAGRSGVSAVGEVAGEAWFPIPPGQRDMDPADPGVVIREIEPERVARCVHRGFPDELGESIARLAGWMTERGLERSLPLHRQLYREAPPGAPGEWVVEIQVPVREG